MKKCLKIIQCLNFLALNVCGLVSKINNPDFIEFISLYDIICLTETKIDQYDEVAIDGFKLLPSVIRQNCLAKSGGICIFVKEHLCKYIQVCDPFTCSSQCVLWFTIDDKLLFHKTLF